MKKFFMAIVCLMTMVVLTSSGSTHSDVCPVHSNECGIVVGAKQCAAMTKKGTRCKRNAESGSKYCWQHNK
jgi:endonuclease G